MASHRGIGAVPAGFASSSATLQQVQGGQRWADQEDTTVIHEIPLKDQHRSASPDASSAVSRFSRFQSVSDVVSPKSYSTKPPVISEQPVSAQQMGENPSEDRTFVPLQNSKRISRISRPIRRLQRSSSTTPFLLGSVFCLSPSTIW